MMTNPMMMKLMLLSLLVVSIGADEDLMKKECHYTDYQNTCLKCLESDPISHQADRVGFSRIIIHCLESQLNILINNVTMLLSKKRDGEPIKKVLENCNKGLSITNLQLREVEYRVVTSNYDKALGLVKTALGYPLTCRDNLQRLKYKESPQVYDQIGLYAQLSNVARTMIQRLEKFI